MKIQTVNQLISVFKDISTRHYQINGFGVGDNWENGASEAKMHPVLWINPTTATMPSSDNGYKTFEIDFEVRVFDLVNKDESNENEVLSDCIDILKDIITEFKGHPYYVNSQLNIIDDINFEAFTEEFDEEVSGWVCEISLMTPVLTSFCGIPSADITGFEFPGADCPEVNVLCPVFVEDVTGVYPIVVTTTGTTKEVSIVGGVGSDTFVISGEYDNGTLTLTRNDNVDVIVTGFDTGGDNDYTTSATLSGNIITFDRTDTVGAYSVDLTSAINSAPDKFVSSGAYDSINNKIVLTLNDSSTVDIDTSAIGGGGASIYTDNDTIGAGRVATLTDTLTFKDGTVEIQGIGTAGSSVLSIYNNATTPGKLWDFLDDGKIIRVGAVSIGENQSLTDVRTVSLGKNVSSSGFDTVSIGQSLTTSDNYTTNIGVTSTVSGNGSLSVGSFNTVTGGVNFCIGSDNFLTGTKNIGIGLRVYSAFSDTIGIGKLLLSNANGASLIGSGVSTANRLTNSTANSLALGWNSATPSHVLGDSLVELGTPTTIKGIGTAGSSALTIYDNDTTPNKLWDFLDNGNVNLGVTPTITANFNEIARFESTAGNPYLTINANSVGNNSGLIFENNGAQKWFFRTDGTTFNFQFRNLATGNNPFEITAANVINLHECSTTPKEVNIGGSLFVDGGQEMAHFKGTSNAFVNIDNASAVNGSSILFSANGANKFITGYDGQHTGGFRVRNLGTAKTGFYITPTDEVILSKTSSPAVVGSEDISLQGDTLLNAKVSMPNLPTSATGLATGDLWNDGGTLKIA